MSFDDGGLTSFGSGVALSGDGRTAVVGGPNDYGLFNATPLLGAAWVFVFRESPGITSSAGAGWATGQVESFTVTSSGFPAPALSVVGALPAGVSFTDNGDGTASLAGTPGAGAGGVYRLTITAANAIAPDATQEFTLTVAAAPQPQQQPPPTPPPAPSSPPPASPSPSAPAPAVLRLQTLGLSVFGPEGGEARCSMRSGRIRTCTVRLVRGGRVLAEGHARRRAGARSLTVALQLTSRGRALLAERLGGVRARLRAQALTSGGTRSASARTRALLQLERFTTPPGSWLPGEAALSERGERFRRSLRGKRVAVAALRCEGHSAWVGALAVESGSLSLAHATLFCRAVAKLGGRRQMVVGRGTAEPIADNASEAGRAKNRRVVVTVTHRPARIP